MAKRPVDISNKESKFRKKKIKLENDLIWGKIKDINEELDINQHEVEKFLLIFHLLMETEITLTMCLMLYWLLF